MKRRNLLWVLTVLALLLPLSAGADELTVKLESHIIDTWDGEDTGFFMDTGEPISWQVVGSQYTAEERPRKAYVNNEWPLDLFGAHPEDPESLGIMGINGAFNRQGYNQIELIPGVGSGDDFTPKVIELPGRVQTIDFWVWGSNRDFYTEIHLIDSAGVSYILLPYRDANLRDPGTLNFTGWQNMFATMPNVIKNAVNRKPEKPALSLSRIVFTTQPDADVSEFYIYLDHLKVLSDMSTNYYDGFDLSTREKIDEIWGSGE